MCGVHLGSYNRRSRMHIAPMGDSFECQSDDILGFFFRKPDPDGFQHMKYTVFWLDHEVQRNLHVYISNLNQSSLIWRILLDSHRLANIRLLDCHRLANLMTYQHLLDHLMSNRSISWQESPRIGIYRLSHEGRMQHKFSLNVEVTLVLLFTNSYTLVQWGRGLWRVETTRDQVFPIVK